MSSFDIVVICFLVYCVISEVTKTILDKEKATLKAENNILKQKNNSR